MKTKKALTTLGLLIGLTACGNTPTSTTAESSSESMTSKTRNISSDKGVLGSSENQTTSSDSKKEISLSSEDEFNSSTDNVILSSSFSGTSSSSEIVLPSTCPSSETLLDSRDNQTYTVVQLGDLCWMSKNLNFKSEFSVCYEELEANCNTYGRLYNQAEASTSCPTGWHLSSQAEWNNLINFVVGSTGVGSDQGYGWSYVGGFLKSENLWTSNGGGSDKFGFSAKPHGMYDGSYFGIGISSGFWTSTPFDNDNHWFYSFGVNHSSISTNENKSLNLYGVRCIRDSN